MSKIFKEGGENKFTPSYVPKKIPHREQQLDELIKIVKDGIDIDAYAIPILYGETGTGKTTTVIHLLVRIKEIYGERVEVKRINATTLSRTYMAVTALAKEIISVPSRGLSIEEILNRLYDRLDIQDVFYVFAIDDADELIRREKGRILELLTRIEENYDRRLMLPIIVVRNIKYIDALPGHITSKLGGPRIEFPNYDKNQLKDILRERVEEGLQEGAITQNAVECATFNVDKLFHGNARELLNNILKAGKIAEDEDAPKIYAEHVRNAIYKSYTSTLASGITVTKARDRSLRILWSLFKALQENPDYYYIDDKVIEKTYENYVSTFHLNDISMEDIPDILLDIAINETQNLISIDDGRLAAAHLPVSKVFNELTRHLFF